MDHHCRLKIPCVQKKMFEEWTFDDILSVTPQLLSDATLRQWRHAERTSVDLHPFHPDFFPNFRKNPLKRRVVAREPVIVLLYAPNCPRCEQTKLQMSKHWYRAWKQMNVKTIPHDICHLIWSLTHTPRFMWMEKGRWRILTWEQVQTQLDRWSGSGIQKRPTIPASNDLWTVNRNGSGFDP